MADWIVRWSQRFSWCSRSRFFRPVKIASIFEREFLQTKIALPEWRTSGTLPVFSGGKVVVRSGWAAEIAGSSTARASRIEADSSMRRSLDESMRASLSAPLLAGDSCPVSSIRKLDPPPVASPSRGSPRLVG